MSKFAALELKVDKPAKMPIINPETGQPIKDKDGVEAYIEVYSSDSEIAREHEMAVSRRRISSAQRNNRYRINPEEIEGDMLTLLASLTAGWYLVDPVTKEGMDIPFTHNDAVNLYGSPGMRWLRDQVNDFSGDRSNFSMASSKN